MLKLGFYDYYLDEWHANNYPAMLREEFSRRGVDMELLYAFADTDKTGGLTSRQWCEKYRCRLCSTVEEFTELCDIMLLLGPSFPQEHERMGKVPLSSGKPVYMDKIFSPDALTGKRIFDYAAEHKTPLFSASALRFADELDDYRRGEGPAAVWCATTGPNSFEIYAIHQIEIIQTVMRGCAYRVKAFANKGGRTLIFDYEDRIASMLQLNNLPFQVTVSDGVQCSNRPIQSNYFENLIRQLVDFFLNPQPPVSSSSTLAVMAMLHAGQMAVNHPDTWIDIETGL